MAGGDTVSMNSLISSVRSEKKRGTKVLTENGASSKSKQIKKKPNLPKATSSLQLPKVGGNSNKDDVDSSLSSSKRGYLTRSAKKSSTTGSYQKPAAKVSAFGK